MKRKNRQQTALSLVLVAIVVVSAVTLGGATLSFAQSPSSATVDGNWTAARSNAARTGATNGTGPSGPYAQTAWENASVSDGRPTGVTVVGGTAYVGYTTYKEYNRENGKVVAYDATTGEVKWSRDDLGAIDGAPAISNGTVYVTADSTPVDGTISDDSGTPGLFALNADTGATKWHNNASRGWKRGPIVASGEVYALTGDKIHIVDADTGTTERTLTYNTSSIDVDENTTTYRRLGDFAVVDDTVYLSIINETEKQPNYITTNVAGTVLALNATDGQEEWRHHVQQKPAGFTATADSLYLTVQPDRVITLSTADGTPRWQHRLKNSISGSQPNTVTAPAVSNGTVYVGTDDDYTTDNSSGQSVGTVVAIAASNGQRQWRFETAADITSAPTVTGNSVYVGGAFPTQGVDQDEYNNTDRPSDLLGTVYSRHVAFALNRNDGSERWSYATDQMADRYTPGVRSTIPANGHLYVWMQKDPQELGGAVVALKASDTAPSDDHRLADDKPVKQTEEPGADIATDPKNAEEIDFSWGATVTLNASNSGDPDGQIASYEWDLDGDGTYETSGNVIDVKTKWCGKRTMKLRVTDDDGGTDTATMTLTTTCSPSRNGSADEDWSQIRNDAARTGATDNSGPDGLYVDEAWDLGIGGANGAVVHDDTVYASSTTYHDYNQENGKVVAHNATTGGLLWKRTDLGEASAPIVVGDTVFVYASTAEERYQNGAGGKGGLFALDAQTGETKWHRDDGSKPVYDDGRLYVTTSNGVEAVNPNSGTTLWTATNVSGSLGVSDGTVYALDDYHRTITALDADNGAKQWTASLPVAQRKLSGFSIANGHIYVTENPDTVYALSADDGNVLWSKTAKHSLPDSTIDRISAPAVSNGTVYVATDDDYDSSNPDSNEEMGAVHTFDARTGDKAWRFETAADIEGPPTVTDGQAYIGGTYASQNAYENDSGGGYGGPSNLIDTVYASNVVYSLNANSGTQNWSYAVPNYHTEDVSGLAVANGDVFAWTHGDDTYTPAGKMFVLTASDQPPTSSERLANDSVHEQNSPPDAMITTQPPNAEDQQFDGGETVELNASNSSDSDGHIVSYQWDLDGDGAYETTGTTVNVTVPNCGPLTVKLRVTDDDGRSAIQSVTLHGN